MADVDNKISNNCEAEHKKKKIIYRKKDNTF